MELQGLCCFQAKRVAFEKEEHSGRGRPQGSHQVHHNELGTCSSWRQAPLHSVSAAIFLPQSPNCLLSLRAPPCLSLDSGFHQAHCPEVIKHGLQVWTLPLNKVQVSLSSKENLGLCN